MELGLIFEPKSGLGENWQWNGGEFETDPGAARGLELRLQLIDVFVVFGIEITWQTFEIGRVRAKRTEPGNLFYRGSAGLGHKASTLASKVFLQDVIPRIDGFSQMSGRSGRDPATNIAGFDQSYLGAGLLQQRGSSHAGDAATDYGNIDVKRSRKSLGEFGRL
jgi:hypothetical protein